MSNKAKRCTIKTISRIVVVFAPYYEEDKHTHIVSYRDHDNEELAFERVSLMDEPRRMKLQHSLGDSILIYTPEEKDDR